jgi:hypothetical protein
MVEGSKPLGKPKRRCENIKMDIKYTACVSQGSSVSIVSGYRLDDRAIGVRSPAGQRIFFLYPLCPDLLWDPPSLLYNGYRGSFPRE